MSIIYTPYTYLIGWTKHNKWYYGVQHYDKASPNLLWVTYFTSSKKVAKLRKEVGEPDVIQIRKTFTDPLKAIAWEAKVLQRLKVLKKDYWLNANVAGAFCHSEESRRKQGNAIRKAKAGKTYVAWNKGLTKETNIIIREKAARVKGRKCSETHLAAMREGFKTRNTTNIGKNKPSIETKAKISKVISTRNNTIEWKQQRAITMQANKRKCKNCDLFSTASNITRHEKKCVN